MEQLELLKYKQFEDKTDWKKISMSQNLSEAFIREFQDKVDWKMISWNYQKLSEDFIREFKDKLDWNEISQRQTLSEELIKQLN
ncbi:hypothetical protein DD592_26970 [Enterobacter cloacae complex sp. 2DZ2F20B]|nr:hypothetical protein DD592_26970 [Enterobacter cloacae complex sp. 2DZ2F20B]